MRKSAMTANDLSLLALGAALWVAPLAEAQVYKWVDERGVVNYSTTPPANRPSTKVDEDSGRVSTIRAPDQSRTQETQRERALQQRVDELERDAASRQSPPQQDIAAQRQSREDCLAQRRIDCDDPSRGLYESERWYPYGVNRPPRPLPSRPGADGTPGPVAPRPMPR
jgi:hypothetical protein